MIQLRSIDDLRTKLARLNRSAQRPEVPVLPLGVTAIDRALPGGGMSRAAIHEVVGDLGAATGFLFAFLGRQKALRQILWVTSFDFTCPAGVSQLGLDHRRLTVVATRRNDDRLWACEEGLREMGYGAVVLEADALDLTATRRLQLAAEASGSVGFLIRRDRQPSAAQTRWRIEPARSSADCRPSFDVHLERLRGAEQGGHWQLEFDNEALSFNLAPQVARRQVEAA